MADILCDQCQTPLIEIDVYGERLSGFRLQQMGPCRRQPPSHGIASQFFDVNSQPSKLGTVYCVKVVGLTPVSNLTSLCR